MNEETTTSLIDTALASGSATALDPEERVLQELVLTVRDDAPSPHPDFALRMNARVAAGFPRRRRMPEFMTARPRMTALAAACSMLLALIVAVSLGGRGSSESSSSSSTIAASPTAPDQSAASGGGAVQESAPAAAQRKAAVPQSSLSAGTAADSAIAPSPVPPAPSGFVGGRNRKVERSAALTLAAPKDKLSDVGDQIIAVTDRYRGFVMRSSVTSAGEQTSTGSFDLRIPVRSLRPALRDLSALADVTSRTENADDVTALFVNARTRLEELNAERRGLLRRLEKADTDQAAAALRSRIRFVNAQIQSQMSVLNEMKRRTSYASASVSLEAKQGGSGGGAGISDGARDLRDSLVDSANLALRVLGVALPIGLVLALLWAGGGLFSRRRREAALN
jgi:hypothetical protein